MTCNRPTVDLLRLRARCDVEGDHDIHHYRAVIRGIHNPLVLASEKENPAAVEMHVLLKNGVPEYFHSAQAKDGTISLETFPCCGKAPTFIGEDLCDFCGEWVAEGKFFEHTMAHADPVDLYE